MRTTTSGRADGSFMRAPTDCGSRAPVQAAGISYYAMLRLCCVYAMHMLCLCYAYAMR